MRLLAGEKSSNVADVADAKIGLGRAIAETNANVPKLSFECVGEAKAVLDIVLRCPLCLDVLEEPVSTRCGHCFCRRCIENHSSKELGGVGSSRAQCPVCQTRLETDDPPIPQPTLALLVEKASWRCSCGKAVSGIDRRPHATHECPLLIPCPD